MQAEEAPAQLEQEAGPANLDDHPVLDEKAAEEQREAEARSAEGKTEITAADVESVVPLDELEADPEGEVQQVTLHYRHAAQYHKLSQLTHGPVGVGTGHGARNGYTCMIERHSASGAAMVLYLVGCHPPSVVMPLGHMGRYLHFCFYILQ